MLLKYLAENPVSKTIGGIFLLATPFWRGDEDWVQSLKLSADFTTKLPRNIPLFLYHCRDDGVVSFKHLARYEQMLSKSVIRPIESGGNQLNQDL